MVQDRKCSQSEDKWRELHGPPRQWCTGEYHHAEVHANEHSLQVGPITNLMGSQVACVGPGNAYTQPLGYVVIWAQVDGIWGYDEDQIALVIPDFSNFATRVPIILGTPTIGQVVNDNERGRDGCLGNAMGKCKGSTPLGSLENDTNGSGKWPGGGVWYRQRQPINVYSESRNIWTFFLSCNTHEDSKGVFGRMH